MKPTRKIAACLWFDHQAEAAVNYYTKIFKNSKIGRIARYGKEGHEIHGRPAGSVMIIDFVLEGQSFTALNGGPYFKFNEAVSFQIFCDTQAQVDYYWGKLTKGGDKNAQQCGWLKDKFGVSWQIVPSMVTEMLGNPESAKSERAMRAMLQMKKPSIAKLNRAYAG